MPARPRIRYTYEDYLTIPEGTSQRYEIIDGELFVTPSPRIRHQQVVASIVHLLLDLSFEHGLGEVYPGPVTVHLRDDRVTEPDVVFVRLDRSTIVDVRGIHGVPDLIVEILSPSNRDYDRSLKRKRYVASGVPELWIVDADDDTVEVWRPDLEEPERPERVIEWRVGERTFDIPLAEVFRR